MGNDRSTTPDPGRVPWEQQPGESARAYEGFVAYRDLEASRSLRKVAAELKKPDSLVERWSRDHDWVITGPRLRRAYGSAASQSPGGDVDSDRDPTRGDRRSDRRGTAPSARRRRGTRHRTPRPRPTGLAGRRQTPSRQQQRNDSVNPKTRSRRRPRRHGARRRGRRAHQGGARDRPTPDVRRGLRRVHVRLSEIAGSIGAGPPPDTQEARS